MPSHLRIFHPALNVPYSDNPTCFTACGYHGTGRKNCKVEEFAKPFKLSPEAVRTLIRQGEIAAIRLANTKATRTFRKFWTSRNKKGRENQLPAFQGSMLTMSNRTFSRDTSTGKKRDKNNDGVIRSRHPPTSRI